MTLHISPNIHTQAPVYKSTSRPSTPEYDQLATETQANFSSFCVLAPITWFNYFTCNFFCVCVWLDMLPLPHLSWICRLTWRCHSQARNWVDVGWTGHPFIPFSRLRIKRVHHNWTPSLNQHILGYYMDKIGVRRWSALRSTKESKEEAVSKKSTRIQCE